MISVIIPTFNEAAIIAQTIKTLRSFDKQQCIREIIVSDGNSTDSTIKIAQEAGAKVITTKKGRAAQMNAASTIAQGEILYFLHADTRPPETFAQLIIDAYSNGYTSGCFRLEFDKEHWFLKANSWFTRFNINAFRFGDQSLFVSKNIFEKSGGFNENLIILEDQEIIPRLKKQGNFIVLPKPVITSSRKYILNGIYKTQIIYFLIYILYRCGVSQLNLLMIYKKLIKQDKL